MIQKTKILVTPLNWGIGHATRCVPVINKLLKEGFEPIIASDGDALIYLQKEFPSLTSHKLPSYNIKYSKKTYLFKFKLLLQIPKIIKAASYEQKLTQQIIREEKIDGIISDNRFGVYGKYIPSVYITHQINVFSGITTFFTTKIHQKIMRKFDEVWIPDNINTPRFSGKLSFFIKSKVPIKYIGILSRFSQTQQTSTVYNYDIMVILSGLEPQRTNLEDKLILEFKNVEKKIFFVRGILKNSKIKNSANITFVNFLTQHKLFEKILVSKLIIARSGYSIIMDLAILQKKCFFIPTPNQAEQEYLAEHLEYLNIAPFSKQNNFKINHLNKLINYKGFSNKISEIELPLEIFKKKD